MTGPVAVGAARNTIVQIRDVQEDELREQTFDLAIAAAGFEPRATAIPRKLHAVFEASGHVICLDSLQADPVRLSTEAELVRLCRDRKHSFSTSAYGHYLQWFAAELRKIKTIHGRIPRVFIDYTCMPKPFYIGALVAAAYEVGADIVLGYNYGTRTLEEWQVAEVDAIYAIPGLEGLSAGDGRQLHLFSLGFDGAQAGALEEIFQPHMSYALVADPGADVGAGEEAIRRNRGVINRAEALIRLPIGGVTEVVGVTRDLLGVGGPDAGLVIVPLGPKPHALGLGLAALLEPEITFLHVLTKNPPLRRTEASEQNCWTSVSIVPSSELERRSEDTGAR
ncbi:hypothetical protein FGE12_21510 [Aggregicoccus sp. 17bor-14]|uniref:hypothetical protein n=1 Tax=Myxococcaceae TaxID=31 RepID=UPI00129D172C|nr:MULTISPECIES: hypothetical protein [Myxococcaceae]MBF5044994.1 hypothetical protein [Simulacricoccus sp. 17bor-14]MRI90737.1 hypothetical protein [Aggregicoccus sp. 17bor-14]